MELREIIGWATPVMLGMALAALIVWTMALLGSHKPLEQKYGRLSNGGVLFDQVFQPTAYQARQDWESQKIAPVPAPTPDKGPGVLDFDNGTIEIRLDD